MRQRRRALDAAAVAEAGTGVVRHLQALAALQGAWSLLTYVATDNELPTAALIAWAQAAGKRVWLPCLDGVEMQFAELRHGERLRAGAYGIPEPSGPAFPVAQLGEVLAAIPLLAWDARGGRLGRGSGHFDRAFAGPNRPRWLVGLGYEFQQVARLPQDPWDLRLDAVVSENGLHTCRTGDDAAPLRKEIGDEHVLCGVDPRQRDAGGAVGGAAGRPPAAER